MIENLELKLNGELPINREDLFILVDSWGRKDSFDTFDDIIVKKCAPKEKYPLENLDVSEIKSFSFVFRESLYNGDLSKWKNYNVSSMFGMFSWSNFNNDSLKDWNVSNVENMNFMFSESKFSGDISSWKFNKDVSCTNIFYDNDNFKNKYNDVDYLNNSTKEFLKWFEKNREKMKELNQGTKQEVLEFFSFDNKEIEI